MNEFDYIIIGIIAISTFVSLIRGLMKEVFSLGAWVIAAVVTFTFSSQLAVLVPDYVESPTVRLGITAVVLFVLILLTIGVINHFIYKAASHVGLSGTDRLLGMIFGIVRGASIVVIIILLAGLTPLPQESWWKSSILIDYFIEAALRIKPYLPDGIARYLVF